MCIISGQLSSRQWDICLPSWLIINWGGKVQKNISVNRTTDPVIQEAKIHADIIFFCTFPPQLIISQLGRQISHCRLLSCPEIIHIFPKAPCVAYSEIAVLPELPQLKRNFRLESQSTSRRKDSSFIRQANATDGKKSHLLPFAKREEPS